MGRALRTVAAPTLRVASTSAGATGEALEVPRSKGWYPARRCRGWSRLTGGTPARWSGDRMELLVVQEGPAARWGLPRHVLDVSRELHRRGHAVDLAYHEPGDHVPPDETSCRSVHPRPAGRP